MCGILDGPAPTRMVSFPRVRAMAGKLRLQVRRIAARIARGRGSSASESRNAVENRKTFIGFVDQFWFCRRKKKKCLPLSFTVNHKGAL